MYMAEEQFWRVDVYKASSPNGQERKFLVHIVEDSTLGNQERANAVMPLQLHNWIQ
jgi:hypothetical protein